MKTESICRTTARKNSYICHKSFSTTQGGTNFSNYKHRKLSSCFLHWFWLANKSFHNFGRILLTFLLMKAAGVASHTGNVKIVLSHSAHWIKLNEKEEWELTCLRRARQRTRQRALFTLSPSSRLALATTQFSNANPYSKRHRSKDSPVLSILHPLYPLFQVP